MNKERMLKKIGYGVIGAVVAKKMLGRFWRVCDDRLQRS